MRMRKNSKRKHAEMQAALERVRDVAESWFGLSEEERERLRRNGMPEPTRTTWGQPPSAVQPLAGGQCLGRTMPDLRSSRKQIIRTLREHGHQAYLVGGCVRDLLLGREPADYDVTTDATPDEVMRIFPETYAVGAQFGVVLVPVER